MDTEPRGLLPNLKEIQTSRKKIHLRKASSKDSRFLWELANEPEVRANSFSSAPISWEEHVNWFRSKTVEPSCVFFIASDDQNVPVGQVRFDLIGEEAVISISVTKECRGCSYGTTIIELSSAKIFESSDVKKIHAYVKAANSPSAKAFLKANFKDAGLTPIRGNEAKHFVLAREDVYA